MGEEEGVAVAVVPRAPSPRAPSIRRLEASHALGGGHRWGREGPPPPTGKGGVRHGSGLAPPPCTAVEPRHDRLLAFPPSWIRTVGASPADEGGREEEMEGAPELGGSPPRASSEGHRRASTRERAAVAGWSTAEGREEEARGRMSRG